MRSRAFLYTACLTAAAVLPIAAHAAGIPFFGPILPNDLGGGSNTETCALGWAGLIAVINNIIRVAITLIITIGAPLMFAYAGVLLVINPIHPEGRAQARQMLTNLVIGLVIVLIAYPLVSAIMAVLYNPGKALPTWNQIITSGGLDPCLPVNASNIPIQTVSPTAIVPTPAELASNTDCSPATLMAAAASGGTYTLTNTEANTLSCIAVPESTCGKNMTVAHTANGTPTSASGMFQIVFGAGNDQCHNLNFPVCTQAAQAAGWTGSGNLNCSTAFAKGTAKPGMETLASACRAAAIDLSCNVTAAECLVKMTGGYSAWTTGGLDGYTHQAQQACVTQNSTAGTGFSRAILWLSNLINL